MLAIEQPTSLTLIGGLRANHQDSWARFVDIYGPLILVWCRRCGLQDQDAADVCQEVLLRLTNSIERYDSTVEGATFRGWLWKVTRNRIYDHFRRYADQPVGTGGTTGLMTMAAIPSEPPERVEDSQGLQLRLLRGLEQEFKPATWTAFWRAAIDQDAAADIAADLGLSVWAVYKAKSRVLARLRAELEFPSEFQLMSNSLR